MKKPVSLFPLIVFAILLASTAFTLAQKKKPRFEPEDLANPLMGTDSKVSLSNGNTYPPVAVPWGMNLWIPQSGNMEIGKTFVIEAPSNSKENLYIQKATLNGKKHEQNWISHEEMLKGGKLKFDMGAEPNMSRGTQDNAVPYSFTNGKTATQNIK